MAETEKAMSKHIPYVCKDTHDYPNCMFCHGGLFACSRCGCCEGATTTECPGVKLSMQQLDDIYAGKLDFKGGQWVEGDGEMPWVNNQLQIERA